MNAPPCSCKARSVPRERSRKSEVLFKERSHSGDYGRARPGWRVRGQSSSLASFGGGLATPQMTITSTLTTPARSAHRFISTETRASAPFDLVVLLSDAALQSAATARDAILKGDLRTRRAAISRMLAIVAELQNTLDIEHGGKIAEDLDRLYAWVTSRLIDATIQQTVRPIDDAVRVLEPLRNAWQSIAAGSRATVTQ